MLRAMRRVLETEGFITEGFGTAEAFLVSGAAARVQCLVLDIRLPGISGIELHRHLASIGNAVPAVFVTAHDDPYVRRMLVKRREYFLLKPFLGETLVQAVSKSIADR